MGGNHVVIYGKEYSLTSDLVSRIKSLSPNPSSKVNALHLIVAIRRLARFLQSRLNPRCEGQYSRKAN